MDDLTRLFLAARDGDREALAAAVRAGQADVWRYCAHLVGAADADDVAQDALVRAWRALPRFRADSSARTWLLSIARRACADWIRGQARRRRVATRAAAEASVRARSSSDGDDPVSDLFALVQALELEQREAFVLTQVVGCPYAEAATICGIPVGTIRSRVAGVVERLVEQIRAAEAM